LEMEKKDERTRRKGDAGRCTKQRSKKVYGRKRRNPNKGKKTVRGIVVEVAEGSQNFAENLNVEPNVDIELGTVSAAKSA